MYDNSFDYISQQNSTEKTTERTALTNALRKVSDNARKLYEYLPKESWMTQKNLARQIKIGSDKIRGLTDELEEAGLIEIHFESNGKRSNPIHKIVKSQIPIKSISSLRFYAADCWHYLDRNSLVECYLKSGWDILPFEPREKRASKNFDFVQWRRKASAEKMDVFFNNPAFNVGLRLPNVIVVDVETKNNCWANHDNFQNTLTVSTPRGFHFYFSNDLVIQTSVNALPDIDIRGVSNFVVLPGSIHPSGARYEWHNLQKPCRLPIEFRREWRTGYFQTHSKIKQFRMPSTIPAGKRNDTLWRYGRSLHWHGKNYFEIESALQIANQRCNPPFSQYELEKLVNHVYEHRDQKGKYRRKF